MRWLRAREHNIALQHHGHLMTLFKRLLYAGTDEHFSDRLDYEPNFRSEFHAHQLYPYPTTFTMYSSVCCGNTFFQYIVNHHYLMVTQYIMYYIMTLPLPSVHFIFFIKTSVYN